jgi:alkanesulfonate monooxygenase
MQNIQIFSTCPASNDSDPHTYLQRVVDVARWSEQAGCCGILVYTDNGLVDPWLVSQLIIQNTTAIAPLVAVQPIYMHPYTVAKMVSTLGFMYGRRVYLNMVAGGFRNDLMAMGDETPHDDRYVRLVEYTQIIKGLLQQRNGLSLDGKYYHLKNLKMMPPLPDELMPGMMISGSSDAGFEAARVTGATAIKYPKPPGEEQGPDAEQSVDCGVRIGIIARADSDSAWSEAHRRFPVDRKGQLAHQLAMKVSDSHWHQQLSARDTASNDDHNPYWLIPFQNYKTFCPYLVGNYQRVADEIASYLTLGYRTFVLDIPPTSRN